MIRNRRIATLLKLILVAGALGLFALVALALLRQALIRSMAEHIYHRAEAVPARPVAMVFGAGVESDGRLSSMLADRVETAIELYQAGRVRKLLMTGDNRFAWYNEPAAMAEYAMERGVPAEDIVYDYAGRRTYDSCYRGRHIFGIEGAVLVTQEYHLSRALYTCRQIGIDAVGMAADRRRYYYAGRFIVREVPALLLAWVETNITHPVPVMGDPIEIVYE